MEAVDLRHETPPDRPHTIGEAVGTLFPGYFALVMATGRRSRFSRFPLLFLAFLDQELITKHLPDDLFRLGLGSLVKFAHCGLLPMRTASGCNVSLEPLRNRVFDQPPPRSTL